jgi:hypothetical protein
MSMLANFLFKKGGTFYCQEHRENKTFLRVVAAVHPPLLQRLAQRAGH